MLNDFQEPLDNFRVKRSAENLELMGINSNINKEQNDQFETEHAIDDLFINK